MSGLFALSTISRTFATACPPWCTSTAECGPHREDRYHAGRETSIPLGPEDVTAAAVASRDDTPAGPGTPYVWLCGDGPVGTGHDWTETLTPAAAIQLGQALIAAGLEALQ